MINLQIPPANADISRTVTAKYKKLATWCIVWTVIVSIAEVLYLHEYFSSRLNVLTSAVIWIALCTIPFFKMKGPQLLLDRSWSGTLMELRYERIVKQGGPPRKLHYAHEAILTIQNGNQIILYKLPCESASTRFHYRLGDRLCRFRGTTYPIYATEPDNHMQICPICGTRIEPGADICFLCRHSRIDPTSLHESTQPSSKEDSP